MIECVVNVSEGRDVAVLARLAEAAGPDLLDLHADRHHHRAVLSMVGEDAPRRVATVAVEAIDLRRHEGVHPRLGAVDVAPFVPLHESTMTIACRARDDFAHWMAQEHGVPCFLYGEGRPTLPDVRRRAFTSLNPDTGPAEPHETAGACAVGCRGPLIAYNVWVDATVEAARDAAKAVRGKAIRALGLQVGARVQVSMNLIDPMTLGPAEAYDRVSALLPATGAELVGLLPAEVLASVDPARWEELDLAEDRAI